MITSKLFYLKPSTKNIINYVLYGIFFFYIGNLMLSSKSTASLIIYSLFILIFGGFVFLNEYLINLYKKSISILTSDCDPKLALQYIEKLNKLDIFKVYKKSYNIFNLLALRDLGKYIELECTLNKMDINKIMKSPDLLLIYYYSYFICFVAKDDRDNVKYYYDKLILLKEHGVKNKKANPLISWDELHGMYYYYIKDYKNCNKSFKKVNINHMNNRESIHFFTNMLKLEKSQNNKDNYKYYLNKLNNISNKMFLSTDIK